MSSTATVLVLSAAILHAVWNGLVKAGADRLITTWAIGAGSALVNIGLLVFVGLPDTRVWTLVAVSAALHVGYNLFLAKAYEHADLAVAYPIARGIAPTLIAVGGIVLLGDTLSIVGVAGIALVTIGLVVLISSQNMHGTKWAVATGILIAAYTVVDGAGVRANNDSVQFISLMFTMNSVALTPIVVVSRGWRAMRRTVVSQPSRLFVGSLASSAAYLLVMIAARTEPLGLVSGLRETSTVLAVVIGHRYLRERVTQRQIIAVVIAAAGAIAIALG